MKKLLLFLLTFVVVGFTQAQIFGKKMDVGVKNYEVTISNPELGYEWILKFKDLEGEYDVINFKDMDEELASSRRIAVYDPKLKVWRLPIGYHESNGVAAKEGEEPLQLQVFILGEVTPVLRHEID